MKICFLLLIVAVLQFSLNLRYGSAEDCDGLQCEISRSYLTDDEDLCILGTSRQAPLQDVTFGEEEELISSCSWNEYPRMRKYRLNLIAPEGWVFLLQLNSTWMLVEVGDAPGENQRYSSSSLIYNTTGNDNFLVPDHYLSTTNRIWIRLSYTDYQGRSFRNASFNVRVRTVQKIDTWTENQGQCTTRHDDAWGDEGYDGSSATSGSLYIMCNGSPPPGQTLITFHYNITKIDTSEIQYNGFIQIIYNNVNPRFLIDGKLSMTCNFSNQNSFWIRFDAIGSIDLQIYDVVVQYFIYDSDDDDIEGTNMPENVVPTSSPSLNSASVSPPLASISTTVSISPASSPSKASTSAEEQTSFTQRNVTTESSMDYESLPIILIATVSGVAPFVLVFFVVLCICLRKRCHKNQSGGRESAQLDDLASSNNEQHEYCEVRPSVKSPPYTTLSGVTDQSVGQKNYAFVVNGPAMVVTDEETVHSDDKTAEVNTPTANNKVLSNGPVYTMVDMDKKALDREEKANIARNRGKAHVSNVDKLDFIPLDEYETVTVSPPVSLEASASLRPDSYPLNEYETVSPPMSPAAMAPELERPYDILQRGPVSRKQTATSSTVDTKAKEEANHDDALNVYNEIATPAVALMESEEGSEAYQHLQRPLSKRPKAGASLPEIPDEGYGRLNLQGSGAINQTDPVTDQAYNSQGPKTTQVDPMYAILEKPAEANVPDDDDPEYDLLDACV